MLFKVVITQSAEQDLQGIVGYITTKYSTPVGAKRYIDDISAKITSLAQFPEASPRYQDADWKGLPLYSCNIRKHKIFYTINHGTQTIEIIHIVYNRRDFKKIFTPKAK
ncbi:type II toxin-antitoxin system RelE/ParE family toxin [Candidatus Saccharibacteria bacterium]|nr:type II toxin-antitoxin system RelE/ParE family toxin [Candidatus Saccharibacteria bacterium]